MLTILAATALAGAQAPSVPAANPHAQHGQSAPVDPSKMDHSKMGQKDGCCCCKKSADGKMECAMPKKAGAEPAHQGQSGN